MTYTDPTRTDDFSKRFLISSIAMTPAIIAFLMLRMRYVNLVFSDPQISGWIVILGPAYLMMYVLDVVIVTISLAYIFSTSNIGKKFGGLFAFIMFLFIYVAILGEMKPAGSSLMDKRLSDTYYMPLAHFVSFSFVLCVFVTLIFFGQSKQTSVYDPAVDGNGEN